MSGHVTDRLGDIVAGRLGRDEQQRIDEHVKRCPECASKIAWTRRLREEALRQGVRHPSSLRIVELGRAPEAATEAEREHLASCADCGGELHWVEGLPASGEAEEAEGEGGADAEMEPLPSRPARRKERWPLRVWLPVGLSVAALLLVLFLPRWGEPDLSGLAVIEPLPVRTLRGVPEPGTYEDHLQQGLAAYRDADYRLAESHLEKAAALRSADPVANLYLGSAYLLLDVRGPAVTRLEIAEEAARDPALKAEAAWQLANALVLTGSTAEAKESLETLAQGGGQRQSEARELLEKLGGTP